MDWIFSKGSKFFVSDFATDVHSGDFKYVLTTPTFVGLGVSTGLMSYVVDKEFIEDNFILHDESLKEVEERYTREYFKSD